MLWFVGESFVFQSSSWQRLKAASCWVSRPQLPSVFRTPLSHQTLNICCHRATSLQEYGCFEYLSVISKSDINEVAAVRMTTKDGFSSRNKKADVFVFLFEVLTYRHEKEKRCWCERWEESSVLKSKVLWLQSLSGRMKSTEGLLGVKERFMALWRGLKVRDRLSDRY